MKITNFFRELFSFGFVKCLTAFLLIVFAGGLTVAFISQEKKPQYSVQTIKKQQQAEVLNILQNFGNAYVLFGENDLNTELLTKHFLPQFILNLRALNKKSVVLPINVQDTSIDLALIDKFRQQFANQSSNLSKQINAKEIDFYFANRRNLDNLKVFLQTLIEQADKKDNLLNLLFKTVIFNDEIRETFFVQLKNIYQSIISTDFINGTRNVEKWVVKNNYVQFLLAMLKLFKTAPYTLSSTNKLAMLINFFRLFKSLQLQTDALFNQFLTDHFQTTDLDEILQKLTNNDTYRRQITTKLNSLYRKNRLDLDLRKHIFRIVTFNFVDEFINELFFNTSQPNNLLLLNAQNAKPDKIIEAILQNPKVGSFAQFFLNLLFFDYLIVDSSTIPKTFRQFIDVFTDFVNRLNFRSVGVGYLLQYLNAALPDFFQTGDDQAHSLNTNLPIKVATKLRQMPPTVLKTNLINWITVAQDLNPIFKPDLPLFVEKLAITSLTEAQDWLQNLDPTSAQASNQLIALFVALLNKSSVYVAFTEILRIDPDNLLGRLGTNLLATFLQTNKDNFLKKNLNLLKAAKFLVSDWELNDFKLTESFDAKKQTTELNLRQTIATNLETFVDEIVSAKEDFNPFLLIKNVLDSMVQWLEFLWTNFLSQLPFLNLNFLFTSFFNLFLPKFKLGQLIADFANFGDSKIIYGFLITFFKLVSAFLEPVTKLPLDWKNLPDTLDYKIFVDLIGSLGYDAESGSKTDNPVFTKNSFFSRFFTTLRNGKSFDWEAKNFVTFLKNKLLGKNGFFKFAISKIDEYLDNNFHLLLRVNNWNYEQITFENWMAFFDPTDKRSLNIKYLAKLKNSDFQDVSYRFSWKIIKNNGSRTIKLISIERLFA